MTVIHSKISNNSLEISLEGNFEHIDRPVDLYQATNDPQTQQIVVDGSGIEKWDSSLLLILFELSKISKQRQIKTRYQKLPDGLQRLLDLALAVPSTSTASTTPTPDFLTNLGESVLNMYAAFKQGFLFSHQNLGALWRFISGKTVSRRVDFLLALQECGPQAVGIVSLISFMVGLILAFVGSVQLKSFGAQIYVASLVTIGMTRIMGAIMAGIIMAGRTGASFAATLGTMQVNEEIDALKTMGIPVSDFLVLPRTAALILAMPLLTTLADFMGMLGGSFVGVAVLDIPAGEYWKYAWQAWSATNYWVGVFHGFVFGFIIALCGCYYGINSGRNAGSVGIATTKAVVSAIVWMIVATGIITLIFERLGI